MAKARQIKKMLGGALESVCPPGFLCMDTGFVLFVIVILATLFIGIYIHTRHSTVSTHKEPELVEKKITIQTQPNYEQVRTVALPDYNEINVPASEIRDHQREYDKRHPTAPERSYGVPPDMRGFIPPPGVPVIPIQIPTQGMPQQFQQIGVLAAPGGTATSATPNRTLLPLFGRKTGYSKDRYNYYTRSDGINPIQVSVTYKNRDCEDDNGCDEIMSGDTVGVPLLGQTYVATTYRYTLPRYIPYVT